MMDILLMAVRLVLLVLIALLVGRLLVGWFDPQLRTRPGAVLRRVTEPLLAPIRRFLPRNGAADLAPIGLVLILAVLLRITL